MSRQKQQAPKARMPKPCERVFNKLSTEAVELHIRWLTYRELFTVSARRVELLNACAGVFFHVVHDALLADILLAVCKLTDSPGKGDRTNLSIRHLHQLLESHGESIIVARGERILRKAESGAKRFRIRRNRKIAHLDLETALGGSRKKLPGVSRQKIEHCLAGIRGYLNAIALHYSRPETAYASPIVLEGAATLVEALKSSQRYEEHVQTGVFPLDDFRQGKWSDA